MTENKDNKEYKPVYVEWDDSVSDSARWTPIEDAKEWGGDTNIIQHVGYVIEETDQYLLITPMLHKTKENINVCFVMKIPKCSIKKRIELVISS